MNSNYFHLYFILQANYIILTNVKGGLFAFHEKPKLDNTIYIYFKL